MLPKRALLRRNVQGTSSAWLAAGSLRALLALRDLPAGHCLRAVLLVLRVVGRRDVGRVGAAEGCGRLRQSAADHRRRDQTIVFERKRLLVAAAHSHVLVGRANDRFRKKTFL